MTFLSEYDIIHKKKFKFVQFKKFKAKEMPQTALITGASRGIGAAFAQLFAADGIHLILTARSETDLKRQQQELQEKYGIKVHIYTHDLTQAAEVEALFDDIKSAGLKVHYLVNNAGFGDFGSFDASSWQKQAQMIELNIKALTHLCHLFVTDWADNKQPGRILNISSTGAFQPGAGMSVYFASKAYVSSFSQALHYELKQKGISVTTLYPGPTRSAFANVAAVDATSNLFRQDRLPTADNVARLGYRAMMKGRMNVIHGRGNRLLAFFTRLLPRKTVVAVTARIIRW